ncbi:DNA methylase [Streptomyces sp. NBC_01750]|uniref:DNA methylase n=1 Tax=Streptomyces sp. NBC_01750 TaxID=2975928 RepID=UPI002DDAB2FA|nr:DNA methylase [Streptomyces sp. NBC_01750]WSD34405.1 DNA methylase [Streptomyces sp. NBC_01750]
MTQPTDIRRAGGPRPLLLDVYSCSGGAGMGYHRAGFDVDGIDIAHRPNYPFPYHQGDALERLASGEIQRYAFVHASPPCQAKCSLTIGTNQSKGWGGAHEDLLAPTRELLDKTGLPYVIEQPNGRAEIRKDLWLCGEMWGLGVIRHRNFKLGGCTANQPDHLRHRGRVRGYRHGEFHEGPYVAPYGNGGGKPTVPELQEAMGITWTNVREELTEAIPPAYSEYIGRAFRVSRAASRVAA